MNFFPRSLLLGVAFAASATLTAAAAEPQAAWEAPPGWTETRGGAGGNVLRVTTLDASGPGSLAEAIATSGARTIEFAVAGDIDLGWNGLKITEPYLTIAGETAPSPGITLTHGGVVVGTHDVIIRHIRIRPSDGPRSKPGDRSVDSLTTAGGAYDVIVDHCSFAWGTDENLSASGPRFNGATPDDWRKNTSHRITFSNCIVGEGVHESNPKGTLVHDNASDIAIIGNLYISHGDRHPLFKGGARAAAVNNLIHNPGRRVMQYGFVPAQWTGHEVQSTTLTMVGNVARKGPSSAAEIVFFEIWPTYGPCDFYLEDNLLLDAAGKSLPAGPGFRDKNQLLADAPQSVPAGSGFQFRLTAYQTSAEMRWVAAPPLWPPRLKARPASETTAWVLANAGARPWDRDALDRRLVEEARSGGGKIIAIKSEAGGPR